MEFELGFGKMFDCGDRSSSKEYPMLFEIARHKHLLVADVLSTVTSNIKFRHALTRNKRTTWLHLVERLMDVSLSTEPDVFRWKRTTSGVFSVKSLYADFHNGHKVFFTKIFTKA